MPGQCPRCQKPVYFAEEKIVLGRPYHKMCIKCAKCNKLLDSSTFTEHDEEMYCKSCYGRLFGPKGYGYGVGAGVLSMDDGTKYQNGPPKSNIPATVEAYIAPLKESSTPAVKPNKPKWGGADYCVRCSKQVFMAERKMAAGGAWHKACFNCHECHKRLDSHSIREREQDIYCNPCYGKNFGPKGYWGWSSAKVS
ncbi:hypothetical protein Pmani_002815 [Petrolisthes manimaculis]|uniref:LIM zinc-binding domain-containing protein n=1 Tax=Petrolisthes manimaculis TaxID=1843537 RepID=A0AAE1QH37_9EUCA|nr:hypothetical protein Pmani_002815 [Petrolisthes manimaculis]